MKNINMLYNQLICEDGRPAHMHIPNEETERIMKETDQAVGITTYANTDEMYKDLGI
ncbi:MAG: hypothetical protein K0R12_545 [Gammaproteobacteria bacterium]|jgi:antitoxin component of RelBE/YafQ-DinJ toxin-antitoxin module|nr:hypothetical protein [Gammaproteobacteria bacterium]